MDEHTHRRDNEPDEHRHHRTSDLTPAWLLPVLVVLALFGAASVGLTIQQGQEQAVATEQQLNRVEAVADHVVDLAEQLGRVADRNQSDDRLGHRCILEAITDVVENRPIDLPDDCDPIVSGEKP